MGVYNGVQFNCPSNYYNPLSSLTLVSTNNAIINVFHNPQNFGLTSLVLFFIALFITAVFAYGIAVPSGLFIPCILMGSAMGRFFGELVNMVLGKSPYMINSGSYAFIGAAAVLGGVSRMTISLTSILIETTNNISYLLPVMIVLIISKQIGDFFNISLYDIHIELKNFPFVEPEVAQEHECLSACDVMGRGLRVLQEFEQVQNIIDVLSSNKHNGFPVLNLDGNCTAILLNKKVYQADFRSQDQIGNLYRAIKICPYESFNKTLQSKIIQYDENLPENIKSKYIDLRIFMNPSPYMVQENAPLSKVYRLFRGMGIRHLLVIDCKNRPLGIITRKELRSDFKQCLNKY